MTKTNTNWSRLRSLLIAVVAISLATGMALYVFTDIPARFGLSRSTAQHDDHEGHDHDDHDHSGHDHSGHDHEGHADENALELSEEARANLRLEVEAVSVGTFTQYIEVPAVIAAWPGRTHVEVTSPLTGVINSIRVSRGELIKSGRPLFTLRLTHQDLVNTQEQFLTQLGQLDVEQKEIQRLASITSSGAVAGKTRLAREYERDKLMASVRAARQAMLLHGLSERQIEGIERSRQLVREVVVSAPEVHEDRSLHHESQGDAASRMTDQPSVRVASMMQPPPVSHPHHVDMEFLVSELNVRRGQSVTAGQTLATLSDYSELLIEGHAFQRDGEALRQAAESSASLQATMNTSGDTPHVVDGLKVVYIGNEVGRDSRTLPFYVGLDNEIERNELRKEHRYVSWKYKPGQRLTLRLPVETRSDVIVVPKDAVAEEGPERYVFVENGDHFDRVPVRVTARDSIHIALAVGGKLWPGQAIATKGAHQLQMAFKNRSGGAIDPHAGHSH